MGWGGINKSPFSIRGLGCSRDLRLFHLSGPGTTGPAGSSILADVFTKGFYGGFMVLVFVVFFVGLFFFSHTNFSPSFSCIKKSKNGNLHEIKAEGLYLSQAEPTQPCQTHGVGPCSHGVCYCRDLYLNPNLNNSFILLLTSAAQTWK